MSIIDHIKKFHHETEATTTTEYSVMLGVVVVVAVASIRLMGQETGFFFQRNASGVESAFNSISN